MCSINKVTSDQEKTDLLKVEKVYDNSKVLFEFMMEKNKFHWEIFKGIEQKAVNLVLFSGVMIGLVINLTSSFPELASNITVKSIGISYQFIPMSFLILFVSIISGMIVIIKSFFLDIYTQTGFVKEESETYYNNHSTECYLDNNLILLLDELTDEIRLLKKRNSWNSSMLTAGFFCFSIGVLTIIVSVLLFFKR